MRGDRVSPLRLAELVESPYAERLPPVPRDRPTRRCRTGRWGYRGCYRPATWNVDGVELCVMDASHRLREIVADPEQHAAAIIRQRERIAERTSAP